MNSTIEPSSGQINNHHMQNEYLLNPTSFFMGGGGERCQFHNKRAHKFQKPFDVIPKRK